MIELRNDALVFAFPQVHADARLEIDFQRTLRIPDDGREHALPPGLGRFPLRHVDDFAARVPEAWSRHGGVMLPMYQAEALWLYFRSPNGYPFAVKVATGKLNAVSGDPWLDGLHRDPQDYLAVPGQPWLDGYCVEKGVIRQFVAMPLGAGYSAEEQVTGKAEHGGLQLQVMPLKAAAWERILRQRAERMREVASIAYDIQPCCAPMMRGGEMGLAPGGRMRQEIYQDEHALEDWDTRTSSRCFVHIANSMVWSAITGQQPPTPPPTAAQYTRAGLPWFEYYAEGRKAVEAPGILATLKGILQIGEEKGELPLPENEPVDPVRVVHLAERPEPHRVREGSF
jgi:hypothetical protein